MSTERTGAAETPSDGRLLIHRASELLGVPAPTLRSWERRYAMPPTLRTAGGHRRYDAAALVQLGLMRDEIAGGRTPQDAARRVRILVDELNPARASITTIMAAAAARDGATVRHVLDQALDERGLGATIDEVVMPLMRLVGVWWETGRCDVGQEHWTTAIVRSWLAKITVLAPPPTSQGHVLLAVGPYDRHTLSIDAFAALLADRGTASRTLGSRTPADVIVTALQEPSAAGVVLVCQLATRRRPAVESLLAAAETGLPVFYAGTAFLVSSARHGVPGTYLGENLTHAAALVRAQMPEAVTPEVAAEV
ncbi:MerR family transcriptional regulator [Nocardioides psychrotolerans]|uniref:B12 binding domain-containing protein n=1 Tax=Nocardioides psychrotolerans TaxID=1005945 RepID=A0A1I3NI96_9ACTN|nr:MerR family transcriptional regulator [Nocardioides psychrotolerans]GEP39440.1 MerR family transcriptional regulator [Nocardioides psychrotolerans]SFJ09001.1 B12 binding domain-containing protein [Nocardioides psychrotolerans]